MPYLIRLLDAFIRPDTTREERKKLRLLNLSLFIVFFLNLYLLLRFLFDGNVKLMFIDLMLIAISSGVPFALLKLGRHRLVKRYVTFLFPPLLIAINLVYGNLHTELYFSAVSIMIVYIMDQKRERWSLVAWTALCFLANGIIIEYVRPEPLLDFDAYQEMVIWWVSTTGFAINVIMASAVLIQNQRIEEQLSEQNKELQVLNGDKDRFMSIISHDLRGPFTSILGLLEALKDDHDDFSKEEVKEMIHVIDQAANSTFELLEDLLTWSRARLGKLEFKPESIDLHGQVEEAIAQVRSAAEAKSIPVINGLAPGEVIVADRVMLKTVLRNLLSNAIKFTPEGGRVQCQIDRLDGEVVLKVEDNGVGFAKQLHLDKMLENGIASTMGTADEMGTGLGLHICKELISRHQGRIWFESEQEQGTTFFVSIPQ